MCYASASGQDRASIIDRAIDLLTVASVVLLILMLAGCATMSTAQKEAAWRIAARNVVILASAFSPEAKAVLSSCCALRGGQSELLMKQLWTDLDDLQAYAVVQSINDLVTLAQASDEFKDAEQMFSSILDSMCGVVPK